MTSFKFLTLCLFATSLTLSLQAQKAQLPQPTERQVYKTVGDTKLELWIYKPVDWKAADKRSAIVFYHGGGWRGGSPEAFSRQCEKLAKRGMVAMSVQYRLTSQQGVTLEDCVKDARSAFRWVVAHAVDLGIDPAKIAAGGGSAGGHLAASLVTLDQVNDVADDLTIAIKPAALVLFNPAVNLDFPKAKENRSAEEYLSMMKFNPYASLKAGHPPTIIFHGSADSTVPIQTVQDYAAKVKELGGTCEVSVFEGRDHAFFNKEPDVWDTLKQADAFLQKQGLLSVAP
ncbi:alpha/beta hydrolase [soil metagenome]